MIAFQNYYKTQHIKPEEKNKATKHTYQNQEVDTEFLQLPAQA